MVIFMRNMMLHHAIWCRKPFCANMLEATRAAVADPKPQAQLRNSHDFCTPSSFKLDIKRWKMKRTWQGWRKCGHSPAKGYWEQRACFCDHLQVVVPFFCPNKHAVCKLALIRLQWHNEYWMHPIYAQQCTKCRCCTFKCRKRRQKGSKYLKWNQE